MKLKLDENLGRGAAKLLEQAGHEVATVESEGLFSSEDQDWIGICRHEGRCLVTLDLDFSNPLLFKPAEYKGIVVLRLPPKPSHHALLAAVETLISGLHRENISGRLWIVQRGRVREYHEEVSE